MTELLLLDLLAGVLLAAVLVTAYGWAASTATTTEGIRHAAIQAIPWRSTAATDPAEA